MEVSAEPTGLSLVDTFVLPVEETEDGEVAVGADHWPPTLVSPAVWAARVNAVGAALTPGTEYDIAAHLQLDASRGSASGIALSYDVDGRNHQWQSVAASELRSSCTEP